MQKVFKVLIFMTLMDHFFHRDTFKFDEIKDYLIELISKTFLLYLTQAN